MLSRRQSVYWQVEAQPREGKPKTSDLTTVPAFRGLSADNYEWCQNYGWWLFLNCCHWCHKTPEQPCLPQKRVPWSFLPVKRQFWAHCGNELIEVQRVWLWICPDHKRYKGIRWHLPPEGHLLPLKSQRHWLIHQPPRGTTHSSHFCTPWHADRHNCPTPEHGIWWLAGSPNSLAFEEVHHSISFHTQRCEHRLPHSSAGDTIYLFNKQQQNENASEWEHSLMRLVSQVSCFGHP